LPFIISIIQNILSSAENQLIYKAKKIIKFTELKTYKTIQLITFNLYL